MSRAHLRLLRPPALTLDSTLRAFKSDPRNPARLDELLLQALRVGQLDEHLQHVREILAGSHPPGTSRSRLIESLWRIGYCLGDPVTRPADDLASQTSSADGSRLLLIHKTGAMKLIETATQKVVLHGTESEHWATGCFLGSSNSFWAARQLRILHEDITEITWFSPEGAVVRILQVRPGASHSVSFPFLSASGDKMIFGPPIDHWARSAPAWRRFIVPPADAQLEQPASTSRLGIFHVPSRTIAVRWSPLGDAVAILRADGFRRPENVIWISDFLTQRERQIRMEPSHDHLVAWSAVGDLLAVGYHAPQGRPGILVCSRFTDEPPGRFDLVRHPGSRGDWSELRSLVVPSGTSQADASHLAGPWIPPPAEHRPATRSSPSVETLGPGPPPAISSVELLPDRRSLSIRTSTGTNEALDLISASHTTFARPWSADKSASQLHIVDAGFVLDPPAQVSLNSALMVLAFTPFQATRPVRMLRLENYSWIPEYGSIPAAAHIAPDGTAMLLAYTRSRVCILDFAKKHLVDLIYDPSGSLRPRLVRFVLGGELALVIHGSEFCKIDFFLRDGTRIFPCVPLDGSPTEGAPAASVIEDLPSRRIFVQSGIRVFCFDFSVSTPRRSVVPGPAHRGPFAISPDLKVIAIVGLAHSSGPSFIELWDIDPDPTFRPRRLCQSPPLQDHPRTMAFTPDGERLLYSQFDRLEILHR